MSTDGAVVPEVSQPDVPIDVAQPMSFQHDSQQTQQTQQEPANDLQRAIAAGFSEAEAAKLADLSPESFERVVAQYEQPQQPAIPPWMMPQFGGMPPGMPYPQGMPGPYPPMPPAPYPGYGVPPQQPAMPQMMPQQPMPGQQEVVPKIKIEPDMSNAQEAIQSALDSLANNLLQRQMQLEQLQMQQLAMQQQAEVAKTSGWVNETISGLGDEWTDVFGKGKYANPYQQQNRSNVLYQVDQLLNMYQPGTVRTPELVKSVFDYVVARDYGMRAPKKTVQAQAPTRPTLNRPNKSALAQARGRSLKADASELQSLIDQLERENGAG